METSTSAGEIKLITHKKNKEKIISGYAVKWDKWSKKIRENGKYFYERIKKGAFQESLKEKDQISLFLHNKDDFLGSVEGGTLLLEEDEIGLNFKLTLPDNKLGGKVFGEVRNGNLAHASFTFYEEHENDSEWEIKNNKTCRTILKARLYEISPVYEPAYLDSVIVEGDKRINLLMIGKINRALEEGQKQQILNKIKKALN